VVRKRGEQQVCPHAPCDEVVETETLRDSPLTARCKDGGALSDMAAQRPFPSTWRPSLGLKSWIELARIVKKGDCRKSGYRLRRKRTARYGLQSPPDCRK
jgi:hypothetical protein